MHIEFWSENSREIAIVWVCLCCDPIWFFFTISYLKLETEDRRDLKHWVCRIIGSGATVHSDFTMSSGRQESCSFISRCNEEAATLESFEQRVKLFVSSTKEEERYLCGPRLLSTFDPEGDSFRCVRDNLTDMQLESS